MDNQEAMGFFYTRCKRGIGQNCDKPEAEFACYK